MSIYFCCYGTVYTHNSLGEEVAKAIHWTRGPNPPPMEVNSKWADRSRSRALVCYNLGVELLQV